jgi:serine/threonine-protein kinase
MTTEPLIRLAQQRGWLSPAQLQQLRARRDELATRGVEVDVIQLAREQRVLSEHQWMELQRTSNEIYLGDALQVDGYRLSGRLGRGGMADVYRAENSAGDVVAVKLLPGSRCDDEEYVARFERECEAVRRLKHPAVPCYLKHGEIAGRPYMMMELIEGESLRDYLRENGHVDETQARQIIADVAAALAEAWRFGMVHRDIKPGNVLLQRLTERVPGPRPVKICDFGLAKIAGDSHPDITQEGFAIGTPHYMSPEQATGDHSLDPRHDIYSLAATVYHALSGEPLFSGESSGSIMYQQVTEEPRTDRLVRFGIS